MLKKLSIVAILFCLWLFSNHQVVYAQGGIDDQITTIKMKIGQINSEINQAEQELKTVPSPNWFAGCLWIGCVLGLPGAIVWYFTDIKPKGDQRQDLKDKIARLQNEKANLENQLMLLQMQKK